MFTICVLFSSRVRVRITVRIRFSVWLVSCYAHVIVLVSIVIVTLPLWTPLANSITYYHRFRLDELEASV